MIQKTRLQIIEDKIEKAQAKVIKKKSEYDAEVKKLEELFDKREAVKKEDLMEAFMKSGRSYDEVMTFLGSKQKQPDGQEKIAKKRGRKPKKAD